VSTPSRFETKAVAGEAADGELVRLLAVFGKASFTYEANSRRTTEACTAFQSALIARVRETGAPFLLENRSDGLYSSSGKVPADPLREWLRNTLQKALLGGLRVDGGVSTQSLQRFFARLRSTNVGRVRKEATFQTLWPERYDGMELRELRFFGGFHARDLSSGGAAAAAADGPTGFAPDRSTDLRSTLAKLALSDAQLQRILALEQRLASLQTGAGEGAPLSLPREVLATLPADVVDDPAARPVFVDRLLDRFEQGLDDHGLADDGAPQSMSGLVELFRKLPQGFFTALIEPGASPEARESAPPEARPLPSLPHRPEDHADELEDPARLVSLIAALPEMPISLEPDEPTLQAEMLRVCLYQLGSDTTPRVAGPAAARVKTILNRVAPESVKVLEHYLRQALARNSELPTPAAVERTLHRLDQSRLLPELRRCAVLTVERVVRFFPHGFVLFLKSLADGSAADAEVLVRVLKSIPEASLASGASQLVQQKEILDPALLRRLLTLGGRQSLGLARAMLSAPIPAVKEQVVAYLRDLGSEHAEALPLVCLEAENLPLTFLQQLCDFTRTGRPDARLRSQAGGLLYTFIESTPNDEHVLSRKARAIAGLAAFPGPSSEALLKQLVRGQGLLGALNVPAPIRDAVRAVRARWQEGKRV
jgi:hypothetical protein